MSQVTLYAQVRVTVQVYVGTWSADQNAQQLMQLVAKEGADLVRRRLEKEQGRLIGEPQVILTVAKQGDKISND